MGHRSLFAFLSSYPMDLTDLVYAFSTEPFVARNILRYVFSKGALHDKKLLWRTVLRCTFYDVRVLSSLLVLAVFLRSSRHPFFSSLNPSTLFFFCPCFRFSIGSFPSFYSTPILVFLLTPFLSPFTIRRCCLPGLAALFHLASGLRLFSLFKFRLCSPLVLAAQRLPHCVVNLFSPGNLHPNLDTSSGPSCLASCTKKRTSRQRRHKPNANAF